MFYFLGIAKGNLLLPLRTHDVLTAHWGLPSGGIWNPLKISVSWRIFPFKTYVATKNDCAVRQDDKRNNQKSVARIMVKQKKKKKSILGGAE